MSFEFQKNVKFIPSKIHLAKHLQTHMIIFILCLIGLKVQRNVYEATQIISASLHFQGRIRGFSYRLYYCSIHMFEIQK